MKRIIVALWAFSLMTYAFGDVFISEVADHAADYNARFVELYNSGTTDVDLSGWSINKYSNGGTSPTAIALTGTISAGGTFVVAHDQTAFEAQWGAGIANMFNTSISGNGDDVYELADGSGGIDVYGVIGVDGTGEAWEYTDQVASRNSNIGTGTTTFDISQWALLAGTTANCTPGSHTYSPGANVPPVADAGADQDVNSGDLVTLDGSGSSDSDGSIVSYSWVQTLGPTVTLSATDQATVTFTAPATDTTVTFEFTLTVTDDAGDTGTATTAVTIWVLNPISIADARLLGAGNEVVVKGIVTATEMGNPFYIQDATAGLAVYDYTTFGNVAAGDSVLLVGTLSSYHDLLELGSLSYSGILNSGNALPTPAAVTSADLDGEAYEGQLVVMTNVAWVSGSWPTSSGNITVNDGTGDFILRIDSDTDIGGSTEPYWPLQQLIGIVSDYNAVQVQPRSLADITQGNPPIPPDEYVYLDFESGVGSFWAPTGSGSTSGLETTSSFAQSGDYAHTGTKSGKITFNATDDATPGWFARVYDPSPHHALPHNRIGMWVMSMTPGIQFRFMAKDIGAGGDNHYEGGPWYDLNGTPGDWQFVAFDFTNDVYTAFVNSDGSFASTDYVGVTSLQFQSATNDTVVVYVDDISEYPAESQIVYNDFETDTGTWWDPNGSGSTTGLEASSTLTASTEAAYSGASSGKLDLIASVDATEGWYARVYNPSPSQIPVGERVGMWVKGTNSDVRVRMILKDTGTGGDNHYEGGPWFYLSADDAWQFISFDPLRDTYTSFANSDGSFSSSDNVTLTGLHFESSSNTDAVIYVDDISSFSEISVIPYADVTLKAQIGGDAQYRSFWANGSWDADGVYDSNWSGPMVELTDPDGDGIFEGVVSLVADGTTYSWWTGSENDGNSWLEDGAAITVNTTDPVSSDLCVVDPSDTGYNDWVISLAGDMNSFNNAADNLTRVGDTWTGTFPLVAGTSYGYKYTVMHSWTAAYGDGGIGSAGNNYSFTPTQDGDYTFTFHDADNSVDVQQAFTWPLVETFTDSIFDLNWAFNGAAGDGTLEIADSTASGWGSAVGVYTDAGYTGIAYLDNVLGADWSVSADVFLVGPADADAPLYQGLSAKSTASDLIYYRFVYRNSSSSNNGQLKLQGYNGSWHTVAIWSPGVDFETIETGWHNLKVKVIGNDFFAFLDGQMLPGCPAHDDAPFLDAGYPGVFVYNGANGRIIYDNFTVDQGTYPPLANAGSDQFVLINSAVTLNGSIQNAQAGNTAVWTQISGPAVALSDPADLHATFTPTEAGDYVFQLSVDTGPEYGHTDEVLVSVNADFIVPQYVAEYSGSIRGAAIDPATGAVFMSNTSPRGIHYFAPGNVTGTPDDTLIWAGIDGWLGPYGLDMADDGLLYLATYSSGNSVWRFDAYGSNPEPIYTHSGSSRGLSVRGAGDNTEVYLMGNGGEIVKITPSTDTWTATTLFNSGDNASIAVYDDAIYTVGFSDSISKWVDNGSGYENVPFYTNADLHRAQAIRPGADPNKMYVMYSIQPNDTVTYYDTFIGALDLTSGEIAYSIQLNDSTHYLYSYARPYTMDVVDGFNIAWGVGPTGNNGVEPAYPQGTYRGYLFDTTGEPGNRVPGARIAVKPGPEVIFGNMVNLLGERSGDIDGDPITFLWTQTVGPTIEGLDLTQPNLEFQALQTGDYAFQLEVNDGVNTSAPAVVNFTVLPVSFVEDFETAADVPNWGVINDANMTVSINDTMGLAGSPGALDLASNLGFAESGFMRGLNAQPGEYFKLDLWVKFMSSNGTAPTSLLLRLNGLTPAPMVVDLNQADFLGQYGHVVLDGFATQQMGGLEISGILPFEPGVYQHIYLDSLAWTNPATVPTHMLSGTISTSDAGDPTGAEVVVTPYEEYWHGVADNNGAYSIPGIVTGEYWVHADLFGYKAADTLVMIDNDMTLDLTLIKNSPPVAVAPAIPGSNQVSAFVNFDGSGCSDPDNDPLIFHWMGPDTIPIQVFQSGNAGFRPTAMGTYTFSLFVTDGVDTSNTVTFDVNVDQAAPAPERPFTYVDEFTEEGTGWQGLAVDAQSKLWSISYYGWVPNIRSWDADGVHSHIDNIPFVVLGADTIWLNANNHGRDVGLDPVGNVWVSGSGYVAGFNHETGEQIGAVAQSGSAVFSFDYDGNLYTSNVVGNVINKFDTNLELIRSDTMAWGAVGRDFGVSPDGSHILVGALSNVVHVLVRQTDGSYLQIDDLPGPFKPGEEISRVKFDSDGFLYLIGSTTNVVGDDRVYIYNPTNGYATREVYELTGTNSPRGIAFDAALGVLYIADFATAETTIGRYALPGANLITTLYTTAADNAVGEPVIRDSVVTVRGYVTTTSELGGPAYIQAWNSTVGMAVYDSDFHNAENLARGQYVEITGTVGFYNGLSEITNVAADGWSILANDIPEVQPLMISAGQLLDNVGEALEGVLVQIDSVSLVDPGQWPAQGSHATVYITDGVDTVQVRIDRDTDIDGTGAPTDQYLSITGVVSQYDGSSPYFSGYQLMPRNIADFHGSVVSVNNELGLPKEFALDQNYPNPFNASTTIKYALPRDANVRLVIYNLLGQKVITLINRDMTAGYKTIQWNGINDFGQNVASGLYIMRLTADKNAFTQVRKLTIIK